MLRNWIARTILLRAKALRRTLISQSRLPHAPPRAARSFYPDWLLESAQVQAV
jgi:hypothetical protein